MRAATAEQLRNVIQSIPAWRRWIICRIVKRREHALARAYSQVLIDYIYENHPDTEAMRQRELRAWASVYRISYLPSLNKG